MWSIYTYSIHTIKAIHNVMVILHCCQNTTTVHVMQRNTILCDFTYCIGQYFVENFDKCIMKKIKFDSFIAICEQLEMIGISKLSILSLTICNTISIVNDYVNEVLKVLNN